MPDKITGPLGPRRSIAKTLRRLRDEKQESLEDVAAELMISTSKLSRLENAQGKPQPRDIRDLIKHYGLEGTKTAANLQRWVDAAKEPGWWTRYDDAVLENLDAHLAYEADATVLRAYTLPFVPALLQTREYSHAIYRDMEQRSEDQIKALLDIRQRRQDALRNRPGLPPLQLIAVTHQSTLHQLIGSRQIMHDQLDALAEHDDPNVRLHVLPSDAKPVFGMTCMYAYFEYEPDEVSQDVVHIETHYGFLSVDDPPIVAKYRRSHEDLVRSSLNEAATRDMIRSIRDSIRIGS